MRFATGEKHFNNSYNKRIINMTRNANSVSEILKNATNIYVVMGCFVKYEYVSAEPPTFLEVENLLNLFCKKKLINYYFIL